VRKINALYSYNFIYLSYLFITNLVHNNNNNNNKTFVERNIVFIYLTLFRFVVFSTQITQKNNETKK